MFYGGRLLSHLCADDLNEQEVENFISLRRLNRYISIVIDSDRSKQEDTINKTKERIRDEFDQGEGFAWITTGREIENYIDPDLIERAVLAVHSSSAIGLVNKGQYENCLHFTKEDGKTNKKPDKVKIAYKVIELSPDPDLDIYGLQEQVDKLVEFIRTANGA